MRGTVYSLFNQLRFKQKLFLSYLIVIIIPILVLGAYSYRQSKEMLNLQVLQSIDKNVSTVSDNMSSSIDKYNHTIRTIIFNATFQKIVTNDYIDLVNLSRDLNQYLAPYFNMMSILDKDIEKVTFFTKGYVPEYGDSVQSAVRVEEDTWYKEAVQGTGSQPNWFYDEGHVFVTGTFPNMNSSVRNLVYMRINEQSFFKNVSELAYEYGIVIMNSSNQIIFGNQATLGLTDLDAESMPNLKEGRISISGREFLLVSKKVSSADWFIYCFVPVSQVESNAGSIINATLIIISVCIVSLLVIISIFSKTMISRIYKLNSLMKRVEVGNLDLKIQSDSKDEIGQLTNQFGNMLIRFNELIDESYRSKIKQKESELKALQWQINPHFLYNTLSFINWQALKNDAQEISHVVTSMAKFYRTALNQGLNTISVRDELENIRSYIEIIQVMREYSFDVEYQIDEAVYPYSTINLILQPLAENAIKHGINKKSAGRGKLKVSARLGDGTIEFEIEDNGPGMSQETADSMLSMNSAGYGLKNVHERLRLLYGPEYGITIHSKLEQGTLMKITCPQHMDPSN